MTSFNTTPRSKLGVPSGGLAVIGCGIVGGLVGGYAGGVGGEWLGGNAGDLLYE